MCDPVSMMAAMAGGQAISGVMSAVGGYQSANSQAKLQNLVTGQNRTRLQESANTAYADTQTAFNDNIDQIEGQKFDMGIEAAKARSTTRTSADNAGVGGQSIDMLVQDFWAQEGRSTAKLDKAELLAGQGANQHLRDLHTQVQAAIRNQPTVQKPSALPYFIQGMNSVLQAGTSFMGNTKNTSLGNNLNTVQNK